MTWRVATRADDELVLAMVRARAAGETSPAVAARFGMTSAAVRIATNRVREADEAHEGRRLDGEYW